VSKTELVDLRNQQIESTKTDWFILVDGDEVWPQVTCQELQTVLKHPERDLFGIVVKTRLPIGDLFHYQSEKAEDINF